MNSFLPRANAQIQVPQPSPYTVDANTVLLDHFDGSTLGTPNGAVTYHEADLGNAARLTDSSWISYNLGGSGEFIVGMKLGQIRQRHDEFYDRSRFTKVNDELEWYETTHNGDRCIITWSQKRAERDRQTREDILSKIGKKLLKKGTSRDFISNKNYLKLVAGLKTGSPTLDEAAIAEESRKDGFFGVITNIPADRMGSADVVATYKHLWVVEDAFGEIKGSLKARPVYHWTDERIRGHLTMCFLAYFCESQITKLLRQKGVVLENAAIHDGVIRERPLTILEGMRELAEVRAIPVTIKDTCVWVRTDIKGNAARLLAAIGAPIPPRLLKCAKHL